MSENVMTKRPRPLWFAIIALYIQTLLNAGGGILLLYLADEETSHGREAPELTVLGFGSLLIALVLLACAVLLTQGVSWARYPVIVIEAIGIVSGVIGLISGAPTAIAGLVLCALVLVNLFRSDVRLWLDPVFEPQRGPQPQPQPAGAGGWVEGRIARVLATSQAVGDPAVAPEHQALVARLVRLGPSALGSRRSEVREIGEKLHRAGGVPLMRAALHQAEVASLRQNSITISREIEMAWNNIGDWLG